MNEEFYNYDHDNGEEQRVSKDENLVRVESEDSGQQFNQDGTYRYKRADNGAIPKDPVKKNHKNGRKGGWVKRAAAFLLAGVLFGGAAGGTFVGVTHFARQNGVTASSQVAENETEAQTQSDSSSTSQVQNAYQSNGSTSTLDVSGIVEQVMPSVVAITNTQIYENFDSYYNYFQYFFGGGQSQDGQEESEPQEYTAGSGSGIIIGENDTEYLIVTNNHVIEGANSLTITFCDDSTATANLKGTDSEADVAVVAVEKSDLSSDTLSAIKVATMGSSDNLKVGEGVIAIGNALGFGQSVTVGYISALNRQVTTSDNITRTLLQTDAAINPGNSGGALVNMNGEIIGINSAKYSDTNVEGVGYAIPISSVQDLISQMMNQDTKIEVAEEDRGYLGINGATVDAATANNLAMPTGVYVYSLVEGGAAENSDLMAKDIITALNGQSVSTIDGLQDALSYYAVGDTVELTVQRLTNGEYTELQIRVTLGQNPNQQQ
mgnify:CR=1 FL=1